MYHHHQFYLEFNYICWITSFTHLADRWFLCSFTWLFNPFSPNKSNEYASRLLFAQQTLLIQHCRMAIVLFYVHTHTLTKKKKQTNEFKSEWIISMKNIWKWSINQMGPTVKTVWTVVLVHHSFILFEFYLGIWPFFQKNQSMMIEQRAYSKYINTYIFFYRKTEMLGMCVFRSFHYNEILKKKKKLRNSTSPECVPIISRMPLNQLQVLNIFSCILYLIWRCHSKIIRNQNMKYESIESITKRNWNVYV